MFQDSQIAGFLKAHYLENEFRYEVGFLYMDRHVEKKQIDSSAHIKWAWSDMVGHAPNNLK